MSRKLSLLALAAAVVFTTVASGSPATAAPPPSVQAAPPVAAVDWEGLPTWSAGYGPMRNQSNGLKALRYAVRDYGINLNWTDWPNSKWEVYGQGLPTNGSITDTTNVAIKVPGGGYLRWSPQEWGIDLGWSSTPVYEWNLITTATGQALYNRTRNDYVVYGSRFWGVNLIWLGDAVVTPPGSGATGVKTVIAYNCHRDYRPLNMWVNDMDAGGSWVNLGVVNSQWSGVGGSCPVVGSPFTYSPSVSNHRIQIVGVDHTAPGCSNNPTIGSCQRWMFGFISNTTGGTARITLS
ncbi:hypothetical protein F4553_001832 [Allocatelliglobosispora scoriae]|uniref:Uncharacterized protein n=1 Tax=Allocatelliglobosispora scoriae TaxID=643052 RepID=A0A841BNC1_9ACTN|nr:hypothetical protein [Allocatelliglobosispora scoriae]MBB5868453.1 hypothetical protein [Allocatelliglobosispora scoriae]